MSEYSGSPGVLDQETWILMLSLPPMRSRSVFQLLPYGGLESMKSNSIEGKPSLDKRRASLPPMMLSARRLRPSAGDRPCKSRRSRG